MSDFDFDRDVCVCFHVPLRKLWHFTRRERPRHFSQLTECLGAGTGCQSCVPLLEAIAVHAPDDEREVLLAKLAELADRRDARRAKKVPRPDERES
jgi:bacterioferritin-associated ferredoxin